MLARLTIRDIVLIEKLALNFETGLVLLTGETGAGKSILLESLGLCLGARAETALIRQGQDKASVTAEFILPANHPIGRILHEADIESEGALIIRRSLTADGRSRAFVNDHPVSVNFLKSMAPFLADIHGQFDTRGLIDPATHMETLDSYAKHPGLLKAVKQSWKEWQEARKQLDRSQALLDEARAHQDQLQADLSQLEDLKPQPGEAAALTEKRQLMMQGEKLAEGLHTALTALGGGPGGDSGDTMALDRQISKSLRALERIIDIAPAQFAQQLTVIQQGLDRILVEYGDIHGSLDQLANDLDHDPRLQEQIEDRLHALKDVARRQNCDIDHLDQRRQDLSDQLSQLQGDAPNLKKLEEACAEARQAYIQDAQALTESRQKAALTLCDDIHQELAPLKLDKTRFVVDIAPLTDTNWHNAGQEQVTFLVSTNPGAAPGPLGKIASGGEQSRLMLALKVVLAQLSPVATLIFDEVDAGIGGAVAAAVGERLSRLADQKQVMVITHSPQVAALPSQHLKVRKKSTEDSTTTSVEPLSNPQRLEEVARMLSGSEITPEARAAAEALMEGHSA